MVLFWIEATPALIRERSGDECMLEDEERLLVCVLGVGERRYGFDLQQDDHWLADSLVTRINILGCFLLITKALAEKAEW